MIINSFSSKKLLMNTSIFLFLILLPSLCLATTEYKYIDILKDKIEIGDYQGKHFKKKHQQIFTEEAINTALVKDFILSKKRKRKRKRFYSIFIAYMAVSMFRGLAYSSY